MVIVFIPIIGEARSVEGEGFASISDAPKVPWIKEGENVSSPVSPMFGLGLWGFLDEDQILGDGWGRVQLLLQPAFLDGDRLQLMMGVKRFWHLGVARSTRIKVLPWHRLYTYALADCEDQAPQVAYIPAGGEG